MRTLYKYLVSKVYETGVKTIAYFCMPLGRDVEKIDVKKFCFVTTAGSYVLAEKLENLMGCREMFGRNAGA